MNLNSYKLSREYISSNPRKEMLREKKYQVDTMYEFAMDREDNCLVNNREFKKSPRLWDRKIKTNYFQTITMETIEIDDYFYSGDLLSYDNCFWICTSSYVFHKLYCKGNFVKCNYLLKWQDENGKIIEKYCLVQSSSGLGELGNNTITIGSDELVVTLPKDEDSLILDTPKSFFIDWNKKKPTAYQITKNNTVPYSDWDYGCINLIVKQRAIKKEDNIDLGICDYITPTTPSNPPDETANLSASISGNTRLKIDYERTYTVTFKDIEGNVIESNTVDYTWNIVSNYNDKIIQTVNDNIIKLKVTDDSLIGESFLVEIKIDDIVIGKIVVDIIEGF